MKKIIYTILILFVFAITSNAQWHQVGQDLQGNNLDRLGMSVATNSDGSIVVVSSPWNSGEKGLVRVYKNISGTWEQIGQDILGEYNTDRSGTALSINSDGSIIAIGSERNGSHENGHVRIFENILGTWIQIGQDIDGQYNYAYLGTSLCLNSNGSIIAIGEPGHPNGDCDGRVKVFLNISGTWTQIGQTIDGFSNSWFGQDVSLSSDGLTVAVGLAGAGLVNVYQNISGTWSQVGLTIMYEEAGDHTGHTVSLSSDGSVLAIGSYYITEARGRVRVYKNISGTWTQMGQNINGTIGGEKLGYSISLNSNGLKLLIGAYQNNLQGGSAGQVKLYNYSSNSWNEIYQACGNEGDEFGTSVSLSNDGNTFIVGAPYENTNGGASGIAKVYSLCESEGIVDTQTACNSFDWIDGNTYTESNNTATHTLTNISGCDSVVTLNLTINNSNSSIDTKIACNSFDWIDGNTYTESNNTATHTLTNIADCDSLITLNLTIINIDNTVTQEEATLTANEEGVSYQWLDCNNNNNPIVGETNQSFTALENGDYAVEIIGNSCSVISDCFSITTLGIENVLSIEMIFIPNPVTNILYIKGNEWIQNISILDNTGKQLFKQEGINDKEYSLDFSTFSDGGYFVIVTTKDTVYREKIIKQ